MSDEAQGEKTLERRAYVALYGEDDPINVGVAGTLHRFLQLARREGGFETRRALLSGDDDDSYREYLHRKFPVTRTVTEPNVLPDPHDVGEWSVGKYGIFWRADKDCGWTDRGPMITPARVRLLNELLDEPTITRTVEE